MNNKISYIVFLLNIAVIFIFSNQFLGFKNSIVLLNITGFFFPIVAIIVGIILWRLIYLSRRIKENRILFLINYTLAIINSLSLVFQCFILLMLILFGTGDTS